jgi:Ca-activated chloride channel homolog
MSSISVSATLEYGKIAVGKTKTEQHLLITLEGKKLPAGSRKPLALSAIIDCSGSMAGDKIETAKKTLIKLIDNLTSEDSLGAAGFSDTVFQIFPTQKMTHENKAKCKTAVEGLVSLASTNLAGGMLEGFSMLKNVDLSYDIVRVFLMTDGLPNVGVSEPNGLIAMVKGRPERVTLSTFGYGNDHDPELLTSMAKAGKGNFYFIKTIDECPSVFGRELGGLLTCSAQNIKVRIKAKPDVKLLSVISDFDVDGKDDKSEAVISVDDVYSEERRQVLLKVEVPAFEKVPPRPLKIADIEVDFHDVQAKEPRQETCKVEVQYVKEEDAQKDATPTVKDELLRIEAAKAQEEAMKLARAGNFMGAQQFVMAAISNCQQAGTVAGAAMADDLVNTVMPMLEDRVSYAVSESYLKANAGSYTTGRGQTVGSSKMFSSPSAKKMAEKFSNPAVPPGAPQITVKPPMIANTPKPKQEGLTKNRSKRS